MNKISQKVSDLRTTLGLSQQAFADRIGFSRNYISRVELGKNRPGKRFTSAVAILEKEAAALNSGRIADARPAPYGARGLESNVNPQRLELRKIPVYSFVQAGVATDFEALPESWESEEAYLGNDPRAFGLRIVGDSMEPKYSPGDVVVVSPQYPATNGDRVVANIKNQGVLFKVMHHSGTGEVIKLTSYNSVYPPLEIPREQFHWIYPVKHVIKP
jgi:phage repressor protein C with HTH and peptisase S24 domain